MHNEGIINFGKMVINGTTVGSKGYRTKKGTVDGKTVDLVQNPDNNRWYWMNDDCEWVDYETGEKH